MHPSECINSFNTTSFYLKFSLRFLILYAITFIIMLSLLKVWVIATTNSILNQYVKFTRFHVRNMIKFFNATKYVSCTFFQRYKSYFNKLLFCRINFSKVCYQTICAFTFFVLCYKAAFNATFAAFAAFVGYICTLSIHQK